MYKDMVVTRIEQKISDKNVVMNTSVGVTETMLGIGIGNKVEYTVFDFSIETARAIASYLKRKKRGVFAISKTSPTTFSVTRLV